MPLLGEKKKKYEAENKRLKSAAGAETGKTVISTENRRKGTVLRNACRNSLLKFNILCFPNSTGLKPFGEVQKQSIAQDEETIRNGGRVCRAEPRAFGKTSRTCNTALFAVLYNLRRMIPVFSANMEKSKSQIMARWKAELLSNEILFSMFPETIWQFKQLGNKTQGAASQTNNGKLTHIKWTSDKIVMPTVDCFRCKGKGCVPGKPADDCPVCDGTGLEPCSGNILMALPLKSCRGATHTLQDGTILRPELCIFDDVQNDEDAENPDTVRKMEELIDHTAMMLGGHAQTMSAIMNCTVRRAGDLSEVFLNKSSWRRVRFKMLAKPALREKELWLGKYAEIRRSYDAESADDQRRAHRESLAFYQEHRAEMDEGAEVTWDWAYAWADNDPVEISAIQHAYNILIDLGPDVFASECQNEPIVDTGGLTILTPAEIRRKHSGYERNQFPRECTVLTSFVDVHPQILYWQVWAWEPNFTGYLIDYGTYPEQGQRLFMHNILKVRLDQFFPGHDFESKTQGSLDVLLHGNEGRPGLMMREWIRGDGVAMKIKQCGIDANGEPAAAIKKFIRQSKFTSSLHPSFGRYVGATSMPMSRWQVSKDRNMGPEWVHTKGALGDPIGITFDTNYWKTRFHRALALPKGAKSSIAVYNHEDAGHHQRISEHWTVERPKEITYNGRTVYEFDSKFKGENHDFDVAVGNMVTASVCGITNLDVKVKKKLSLSELQQKRWSREGR